MSNRFLSSARTAAAAAALAAAIVPARAAEVPAAPEAAPAESAAPAMKPGEYVETAIGWNGPIEVKTTLSERRIEAIEVVRSDEVPYIADAAMKTIAERAVAEQNLQIDAVTGATRSSEALLRAVGQAVESAGGDIHAFMIDRPKVDPAALPAGPGAEADVIVVGGGASGLAAAAAALESGAKVIVLEKAAAAGGSAARSAGVIAAAGTGLQRAAGVAADPEGLAKLWLDDQKRSVAGAPKGLPDAARVEDLVKNSAATVEWLTQKAGVPLEANAAAADGIGAYALRTAGAEPGRPAGAAQTAALERYVRGLGGDIRTSTSAWKIITGEDGRIAGVAAADGTHRFEFRARAVVLATGGFGADLMKVTERQPRWSVFVERSQAAPESTGDGLTLAAAVGAAETADSWLIAHGYAPLYPEITPAMLGERGFAGATLVNERGRRFVREDLADISGEMSQQLDNWLITDSSDPKKAETLLRYAGFGCVVHGDTWAELARRMGVRAPALEATMKKLNEDAAAGTDTVMGRAPANFRPVDRAPYFAVKVNPVLAGTIGGVAVDAGQRVLNAAGAPIPGLYAAGEMANRAYYNRVYEPGTGLLVAYATGRTAGTEAARAALAPKAP